MNMETFVCCHYAADTHMGHTTHQAVSFTLEYTFGYSVTSGHTFGLTCGHTLGYTLEHGRQE